MKSVSTHGVGSKTIERQRSENGLFYCFIMEPLQSFGEVPYPATNG